VKSLNTILSDVGRECGKYSRVRINRFFTDLGYCSRREADKLIEAGRVRINDRLAVLGDQVSETDQVFVDSKQIHYSPPKVYIMYHKPTGITCTTERQVRGNIIDAVNHPLRVFPIGRLDKDSSGLILLTNDGDIVNRILRAEFEHEKEYIVELNKPFTQEFLFKMSQGVNIGDHITLPCTIKSIGPKGFSIILTEGKNRQIRRMCETLGYEVRKLQRIRIMNLLLADIKAGQWKDIPVDKLQELKSMLIQEI
jgi:23S rRNA pseudouridine2604 synthase